MLDHLLRLAVAATFRDRLSGLDLSGFTNVFAEGGVVETGDLVAASDLLAQLGSVPGLYKVLSRLGYDDAAGRGQVAAAAEFTLEGLHLTRRLEKETLGGRQSTEQPKRGDHGFRQQRARSPRRPEPSKPITVSATDHGAAGQTRSGHRSTRAQPSTRSVRTCSRREPYATPCAI